MNNSPNNQRPPMRRKPTPKEAERQRRYRAAQAAKRKRDNALFIAILAIVAAVFVLTVVMLTVASFGNSGTVTTAADTTANTAEPTVTTGAEAAVTTAGTPATSGTVPVTTGAPTATDAPVTTATPSTTAKVELPTVKSDALLKSTADAGTEYTDRIVFLGDSTTYGLKAYRMLTGGRDTTMVWTPSSGTLTLSEITTKKIYYPESDKEILISEAVAAKKPDIIVITLGLNFVNPPGGDEQRRAYFVNEYTKLVNTIKDNSPTTTVILQSIFPINESYCNSFTNKELDLRNKWVLEVAESCGVHYLNTQEVLRDASGNLPKDFMNSDDGIHFNEAGYNAELTYIRTHAVTEE